MWHSAANYAYYYGNCVFYCGDCSTAGSKITFINLRCNLSPFCAKWLHIIHTVIDISNRRFIFILYIYIYVCVGVRVRVNLCVCVCHILYTTYILSVICSIIDWLVIGVALLILYIRNLYYYDSQRNSKYISLFHSELMNYFQ